MIAKTTLRFTDRDHAYRSRKVRKGMYASQGAADAAALERMIRDEEERDLGLRDFGTTC